MVGSLFPLPTAVRCRVLASAALMICVDCSFAFESVERKRERGKGGFLAQEMAVSFGNGGGVRFRMLLSLGGYRFVLNIEGWFYVFRKFVQFAQWASENYLCHRTSSGIWRFRKRRPNHTKKMENLCGGQTINLVSKQFTPREHS